MLPIPSSELIINEQGEIYHLGIKPEDLKKKIIIVGDQDRVSKVSSFFDEITFKKQHREFVCHVGTYQSKEITVLSTGIGTDNIDIVMNELDALVNIDFETRKEKQKKEKLEIVRIGTCGILDENIPVESFILSQYSMGLDNVGHYYQREVDEELTDLLTEIEDQVKFPKHITPYIAKASDELNQRFESKEVKSGITIASSGFYGPQGRVLRLPLAEPEMLESIADFKFNSHRFVNLEMETSALFALSSALGHKATALCLGIANRRRQEFADSYEPKILELIQYVLDRI